MDDLNPSDLNPSENGETASDADNTTNGQSSGESSLPEWARVSAPVDDSGAVDDIFQEAFVGDTPEAADEELFEEIIEDVLVADATDLADAELIDIVEVDGEDDAEAPEPSVSPYDFPGDWFVVHTYAGYENKVKQNLASRVRSMNVEEQIFEVVIPMEDVIEFKGGRKVVAQKKLFPGYLYVRMELDDDSWYVVRNTPGVTGFVGNGARPTPLSRKEVENVLGVGKEEPGVEKKVRPRLEFEEGEQVRVIAGPFADFNGSISDIDVARSKLTVLVNIFGRETPVELELGQVAKL